MAPRLGRFDLSRAYLTMNERVNKEVAAKSAMDNAIAEAKKDAQIQAEMFKDMIKVKRLMKEDHNIVLSN